MKLIRTLAVYVYLGLVVICAYSAAPSFGRFSAPRTVILPPVNATIRFAILRA